MVGHWISGPASLSDASSYTPAGTHDGVAVGANAALLAWSADVPVGFPGQSLDLSANDVAVLITNTATTDGNYQDTFDHALTSLFTIAFWTRGLPPASGFSCWLSKSGYTPLGWNMRVFNDGSAHFTMRNDYGETIPLGGTLPANTVHITN